MRSIIEDYVTEVVRATPEYMKKERVREKVQGLVASMIANGEVSDQSQLDDLFMTLDMSLKALKMVPIDAYKTKSKRRV